VDRDGNERVSAVEYREKGSFVWQDVTWKFYLTRLGNLWLSAIIHRPCPFPQGFSVYPKVPKEGKKKPLLARIGRS
jgi:hypothetical protein